MMADIGKRLLTPLIQVFLFCGSFVLISGCSVGGEAVLSAQYSQGRYERIIDTANETFRYEPVPDKVLYVEAKVVNTKRPLVERMSVYHEDTKTLFVLSEGQAVPGRESVTDVMLAHWTWFLGEPLQRGDVVRILFDNEGNLIDVYLKEKSLQEASSSGII